MIQQNPDSDLTKDIETLAGEVFDEPEVWLRTPHELFGGDTPRQLIANNPHGERTVRSILSGIKHGISP